MARRALSALIVAVGFASLEGRAYADSLPRTLWFELNVCPNPELDADSLAQAVRLELEADGVGRVLAGPTKESDGSLLVQVGCDAALTARIRLIANGTARERHEQIALGDAAPSARPRALALALAELIRAEWPPLSATGPSSAGPSHPASNDPASNGTDPSNVPATQSRDAASESQAASSRTDEPSQAAPRTAKADSAAAAALPIAALEIEQRPLRPVRGTRNAVLKLAAGARLRWFVDYQSVHLGGDLGADFGALRLRAEILTSSKSDALGSASLGSAALCIGYRVFDWHLGPVNFAAYPIASGGLTWLRGSSAQPSTRVEPATGFYGDVRFVLEATLPRWALAPTLSADLGRASGFVARSGDRTLGATGGFFVGASIGAQF